MIASPEELLLHPPPPLPAWITERKLLPCPEYQFQFLRQGKPGQPGIPYFCSNYGPQTWSLVSPFAETVVGGSRGGGKSAMLIAWFACGYPLLALDDPAHYMAILEPSYRGLMLRKEYQSMAEFVDEAMEFYGPLGGKPKDDPVVFTFKSGAKIYTNHLGDKDAFEKYRGWGISRIGIEELTQIEEERWYKKLLGSLRAKKQVRIHGTKTFPALPSQIMSTTNPDGAGACVPYGDVLTEGGWKPIETVRVGEKVWSVDPANGQMLLRVVGQVHSSHYSGDLFEANGRGVHVCCTPNHKILRFNTTKNAPKPLILEEIQKFPGQTTIMRAPAVWRGSGPKTVEARSMLRRREPRHKQPTKLSIEQYVALVGWMVTEGSLVRRDNALAISQAKPHGVKVLKVLLDDCGFTQHWGDTGVIIYSHEWLEHFSWLPHSHEKFIPAWIKNLPSKCLQVLMDAMVEGDGNRQSKTSGCFFSSSAQLATDFCEIALKCGYMVYANGRDRGGHGGMIKGRTITGHAYSHEIFYHRQKLNGSEIRTGNHTYNVNSSTKRLNTKQVPFSGTVYCIGVPNTHTFFIRQHGCVWISGNSWVKKRFIKVVNGDGNYIPWNTPMRDPISKNTRIFIPMSRKENPYLRDNMEYEANLMSQDEVTRRQWMLGDWDASSGTFFMEFRPHGPQGTEEIQKYPWARHVIEPSELKPWWYRFGGGDWGFDHPAVFNKACRSEKDGRIHIYDELSLRRCGSFEMGVTLANWWLPDLESLPDKTVTIALSPDAFSKTDASRTKAEQMAEGIKTVLGPYGAFMLKFSDDERAMMSRDPKLAHQMFDRRRGEMSRGQFCIVLKPANTNRVDGWSYMREQMRWRPIVQESEAQLKERLKKTYNQAGIEAYERELSKVKRKEDGHLPKLQVWKHCRNTIRCLEEAMKDEDKPEDVKKFDAFEGVGGDDALDSLRHALMDFKEVEKTMPKSYYVSERMEQIQTQFETDTGERLTDPTRLIMIQQTQGARYETAHPVHRGFTPARASSARHRKR